MKKYLIAISTDKGGRIALGLNSDSLKPVFIYHFTSDTGARYERIGNASRYLEKLARILEANGCTVSRTFGTASAVPVCGCSAWNNALIRHQYFKEPFPEPADYIVGWSSPRKGATL